MTGSGFVSEPGKAGKTQHGCSRYSSSLQNNQNPVFLVHL